MTSPPSQDDLWLAEWQAAERLPLFFSQDPHVWRMLAAVWLGDPVEFRYWGGSTPGQARRVTPRAAFTVEGCRGVYVEGMCHLRNETRVFRLDRIEWPPDGA